MVSQQSSDNVITRAPWSKAKRGAGNPSPLLEPVWSAGSTGSPADLDRVYRLFGRSLRHRVNRYEDAAFGFGAELDAAGDEREEGVILPHSDITAGMPFGAALARDDVAGKHVFAAENLEPEPLSMGVAPVARGAACFLVSHGS